MLSLVTRLQTRPVAYPFYTIPKLTIYSNVWLITGYKPVFRRKNWFITSYLLDMTVYGQLQYGYKTWDATSPGTVFIWWSIISLPARWSESQIDSHSKFVNPLLFYLSTLLALGVEKCFHWRIKKHIKKGEEEKYFKIKHNDTMGTSKGQTVKLKTPILYFVTGAQG